MNVKQRLNNADRHALLAVMITSGGGYLNGRGLCNLIVRFVSVEKT